VDVAVLGASGDCGREIAAQLVAARLLEPTERLQLVGRADGPSARILHGLVADLSDAYAEHVPQLDVALSPEEIVADLWIVAAGRTLPTEGVMLDRHQLAVGNARIFSGYAEALARHGQGTELVVIVSNPVELGVALFARAVGRDRVIGIGAYQDTMRFRREIAADLGLRRQRVGGFMLGEHGDALAPIWSSVTLHGLPAEEVERTLAPLRRGTHSADFGALCAAARQQVAVLLAEGRFFDAYALVDAQPPDVRVVLKPFITHTSGSKTVRATAHVTVDLVAALLDGRETLIAGQVQVGPGEFHDLVGPIGVPIIAGPQGIRRVVEIPLTASERERIGAIAAMVGERVAVGIQAVDDE
jgi:malate dehydrogenase